MQYIKWKCPHCKKELISLYENQMKFNKKAHLSKHKKEVDINEMVKKEEKLPKLE